MADLTIENFPDELYAKLTRMAKLHGRNIDSEAIVLLEAALRKFAVDVEAELEEIRRRRDGIKGVYLTEADLEFAKNEGRP